MSGFDPSIIQDFLTESGELLEQLDQNLIVLEDSPRDPEMLNQIFRALHTIKGSASFLALTNLVNIAHAAESALNAARNGIVTVDRDMMDLLLEAVDILKQQLVNLQSGEDLVEARAELVERLAQIGEGNHTHTPPPTSSEESSTNAPETDQQAQSSNKASKQPASDLDSSTPISEQPLNLPANKSDLLEFFASDVDKTIERVQEQLNALRQENNRDEAVATITELAESLDKSADFFEYDAMRQLIGLLRFGVQISSEVDTQTLNQLSPRLDAIASLLAQQGHAIHDSKLVSWPIDTLTSQINALIQSEALDPSQILPDNASYEDALRIAGIGASSPTSPLEAKPTAASDTQPSNTHETPLDLPENKASLLEFLIDDLNDSINQIEACLNQIASPRSRTAAAEQLAEHAEAISKSAEFFEYDRMAHLARIFGEIADGCTSLSDEPLAQLLARAHATSWLLAQQAQGLSRNVQVQYATEPLLKAVHTIIEHNTVTDKTRLDPKADPETVLAHDGVLAGSATPAPPPAPTAEPAPAASAGPASSAPAAEQQRAAPPAASQQAERGKTAPSQASKASSGPTAIEQTIRVEVSRLESLLNLVGELVLQKNRISALSRQVVAENAASQDLREAITQSTSTLDRVTGDIQVAVMRTRMQPLDKLFGKYPRLIRDLARKTNKELKLVIEGGDTEVDKSVIEELGDPLVHLLRNAGDHGIEMPADREAAGKPKGGTIKIRASHEGSHVHVQIIDDGKGLHRDIIASKAVEKGLTTEAEIANMSDREVFRFILQPGFSTAAQVSDLSGRGVGMDVVKTNIEKLKGTIDIDSTPGADTIITIKIPLTLAIMTAMMVAIGSETYAVPLTSIVEIVRPDQATLSTIQSHPVMRLRDSVLPLLDGCTTFDVPTSRREDTPFAVVLELNEKRFGLLVSRLIGQQEIVIKPLDDMIERTGPVSGATVRDDGGVSLIVDVAKMLEMTDERHTDTSAETAEPLTA